MRLRSILIILTRSVAIAAALMIMAAGLSLITYIILQPAKAEERITGHRPAYVAGPLNAEPLADYGTFFTVGHNSGTTLRTTRQAITHRAGVLEIDVVAMGNTLVAAHEPPMAIVGRLVYRRPTVAEIWKASAGAKVIQLDIKEPTPHVRRLLLKFLAGHPTDQQVIVTTSDTTTLDLIAREHPEIYRFLSVPDKATLNRVLSDPELATSIDGVTLRYQLVSEERVARLKRLGLIVIAWTVDDLATVNRYAQWGVDGVSTDNLSIMELLGDQGDAAGTLGMHRASTDRPSAWLDPPRSMKS
jgi:glycerophosphoryl diester phosphodiesterase